MTYINHNLRVFFDISSLTPLKRRSEGRLKFYRSTEDVRAWNYVVDDRRRQILELVKRDMDRCEGSMLRAILQVLRAKYLDEVKRCCRMVWMFVNQLQLSEEDKKRLGCLEIQLGYIFRQVLDGCSCAYGIGLKCACAGKSQVKCICGEAQCRCGVDEDGEIKQDTQKQGPKGTQKPAPQGTQKPAPQGTQKRAPQGTYKVKAEGPVKIKTEVIGIKPGLEKCDCVAVKAQVGKDPPLAFDEKQYRKDKGGSKVTPSKGGSKVTPSKGGSKVTPSKGGSKVTPSKGGSKPAKGGFDCEDEGGRKGPPPNRGLSPSNQGVSPPNRGVSPSKGGSEKCNCAGNKGKGNPEDKLCSEGKGGKGSKGPGKQRILTLYKQIVAPTKKDIMFKSLDTNKLSDPEMSIKILTDALEDRKQLCYKQQKNIIHLKIERDKLSSKIQECLKKLDSLKETSNDGPSSSTKTDMEQKINVELEALKQYFVQLRETESENEKLRSEKALLVKKLSKETEEKVEDEKLDEMTIERDMLKNEVRLLDEQKQQQSTLPPNDLQLYMEKSILLDNILKERDEMLKTVKKVNDLEKELEQLRKKADRVDELEKSLKDVRNTTSAYDLRKVRSECRCLGREVDNLKCEREALKKRIDFLMNEQRFLKSKTKECEVLKVERDKLQIKINDLFQIQIHNENLRLKCKSLETVANEAYLYKHKYEELLAMQCESKTWKSQLETAEYVKRERDCLKKQVSDLESVIVDQEAEMKRLMKQNETIVRHKDKSQQRMREALSSMRSEIDKKDSLIEESEQKLKNVQDELKRSIQNVSCETTCYRTRLEKLEKQLKDAANRAETLENQLNEKVNNTNVGCVSLEAVKKELDGAKAENRKLQAIAKKMVLTTGDKNVEQMIKHSESAIKKVVTELSKQYSEWDRYKKERRRQSRSRSVDKAVQPKLASLEVICAEMNSLIGHKGENYVSK